MWSAYLRHKHISPPALDAANTSSNSVVVWWNNIKIKDIAYIWEEGEGQNAPGCRPEERVRFPSRHAITRDRLMLDFGLVGWWVGLWWWEDPALLCFTVVVVALNKALCKYGHVSPLQEWRGVVGDWQEVLWQSTEQDCVGWGLTFSGVAQVSRTWLGAIN